MADVFADLPLTDADIALYATGDYPALTARCERIAENTDGTVPAASFVLTSATPFEARGVQAGHVVVFTGYAGFDARNNAREIAVSDAMPVASVAGNTVSLERFGYTSGQGKPPPGVSEAAGATGLAFFVPSLVTLIASEFASATNDLQIVTDAAAVDNEQVLTLTRLMVLRTLYFMAMRGNDPFEKKYEALNAQIATRVKALSRKDVLAAPSFGTIDTGFAASGHGPGYWCG
jgi:hypothetical protein